MPMHAPPKAPSPGPPQGQGPYPVLNSGPPQGAYQAYQPPKAAGQGYAGGAGGNPGDFYR